MESNDTIFWVFIVFMILLIIFFFYMAIVTSKNRKKAKAYKKKKKQELGFVVSGTFVHFNGLPLSEGVPLNTYWCNDKVVFESNGATYNLPLENLIDVCVKTDVEIQKEYVSSTKKAIAGAALFGTVGAIIASKPKVKETKQSTPYLIFTYKSKDGQTIKYVALRANQYNLATAYKIVQCFYKLPPRDNISFDL